MTARHLLPLLVLAALTAGACQDVLTAASVPCATLAVGDQAVKRAIVEGQVQAPRTLVVEAPGTPGPTGAALDEVPVPQATVTLADALGNRVPGLDAATTDSQGRYQILRVPSGATFLVVARFTTRGGAEALVKTLVRTTDAGVKADLHTATTLVATDLSRTMDGFSSSLEAATFQSAVDLTHKQVNDGNAPDLTKEDAVQAMIATLLNFNPELTGHMNRLKQDLATRPAVMPQ